MRYELVLKAIPHLFWPERLVLLSLWNVFPQASEISSFRPQSCCLLPRETVSGHPSSRSPAQPHHPTCYYRPTTHHYLTLTPVIVYSWVYRLSSHSPHALPSALGHGNSTLSVLFTAVCPGAGRVAACDRHVMGPDEMGEMAHRLLLFRMRWVKTSADSNATEPETGWAGIWT